MRYRVSLLLFFLANLAGCAKKIAPPIESPAQDKADVGVQGPVPPIQSDAGPDVRANPPEQLVSLLAAPVNDPVKREYIRFAALFSMENSGNMYTDQTRQKAPQNATALESAGFKEPTLRMAATDFGRIAFLYELSSRLEWGGSMWTTEEQAALFKKWFGADTERKQYDALAATIDGTLTKVRQLEESVKKAFLGRALHSQLWKQVLPLAKRFGGPDRETLPVRFGTSWVRNTYGKPLTNLTIAIQTTSSLELPDDARLHVVFVESLLPDDMIVLPGWLISKLWTGQMYRSAEKCFRCSIWSDEVSLEDVSFDLRQIDPKKDGGGYRPENVYRQGFFPASDFKGKYDSTTPWIQLITNSKSGREGAPLAGLNYKHIQGPWLLKSGEANGEKLSPEVVKAARMYTIAFNCSIDAGKTHLSGRCSFNSGKMPVEFDLSEAQTPEQKKKNPGIFFKNSNAGPTWLGICKLEDNVFTVCLAPPGQQRPKEFSTRSGAGQLLYVWEPWKRDGSASTTSEAPRTKPEVEDDKAGIARLSEVLLANTWHYHDNLFPPGDKCRFNKDGTFHVHRWNYWVVGPNSIRVHYDPMNHDKDSGVLFTFNRPLTQFIGEFTDPKGKVHKITGTRQ